MLWAQVDQEGEASSNEPPIPSEWVMVEVILSQTNIPDPQKWRNSPFPIFLVWYLTSNTTSDVIFIRGILPTREY